MRGFHRRSYSADPNVAGGVSLQQIGGDEDLLNELLETEDGSRHGPRTGTSMHEYLAQRQGSLGVRTHDPSLAMLQPPNDAMAMDRTSWLMNAAKGGAPWQLQEAQLMQPFPMQQSTGTMQQQTTWPVLTPTPPHALDKPQSSKVITDTQASLDSAMEFSLFEPMALPNSARPDPNHGKGHMSAKGLVLPHVHARAANKGLAVGINTTAPTCMETEDAKRFAVQTRANAFDPSQLDPDRAKRIVANRLSAHRSRQKKLNYMNSMQGDIVHVSQNTLAVVAECQRLIAMRAQSLTESDQLRLRVAALAAQVKAMEEHQNTLKSRRQQIKDYTEVLLAERRVNRAQGQPSRSNEASTLPMRTNGDLPQPSDSSGQRGVTGMTPLTASVARTQEAHHQAAMADSDGLPSSSAGGAPAGSGGLGSGDLAAVRGLRVSAVAPGQGRDVSTSAPPTPATLGVLPTPWTAQQLGSDMSQQMPGYVSAPQGAAILPSGSPLSAPLPSLQQPQSQLYTTLTNPSSTPSNPRNSCGSQQHSLPHYYHQHSSGQVLQQAAAVLSNDDLQAPRLTTDARPSQAGGGGGGVLATPSWSNSVAHTPATNHGSPTLSQGISLEAATLDPTLHATHGLSSGDNPSMHQPPPVTTQWDARAITAKEHMYGKFAGRLSGTNHVPAIPVHSPLAISQGPSAGQPSSTGALCALQQQQPGSATAAKSASPSDSGAGGGGGGATITTSGGCAVGNGASQGNNKAQSTSPASSFGAPRLGTLDGSTEWALVANLPTCPLPVGIKDVRRFLASDDEPLVLPDDDAKAKPLASGGTPSGAGGDAGNRMGSKSVVMETTSVEEPIPAPIESLREELLAVTNPLNAGTGGGTAPGNGRTNGPPSIRMNDSPNIMGSSPSGIGGSSPQGGSLLAMPSAPMFGSFSIPFASQSTLSLGGLGTVSWLWSNDVLGAPAPGSNSAMDINRMSVGEGEISRQSVQGLSPEELENQVERLSVGLSRLSHEESLRGNSTRFPPPGTNQSGSPATPQGGVSGGSPEAGRDSGGVNGLSPRLAGRMSAMLGTGMMLGGGGISRGQVLSLPSRLRHGQFVGEISRMSGMMPGSGPVSGAMEGLVTESDLDQLLMSEMSHG